MKRLLLLGDSIRIGYLPFVTDMLKGEATVHGYEQNAGTTAFTLEHLDAWLEGFPADVIHANNGLHDLARELRELRDVLGRGAAGPVTSDSPGGEPPGGANS